MKNPVLPASGTFEINEMTKNYLDPGKLGALINKTVFKNFRPGNDPPRIVETSCGILNSVGIPSKGIEYFLEYDLKKLCSYDVPVIVSVAGASIEEFSELVGMVSERGMGNFIELDLSCPNLEEEKIWATDANLLFDLVKKAKKVSALPIIAKLSPQVSDIAEIAAAAESAGADMIALINTIKGMKIDISKRKPFLGNLSGGLSGPAILPIAVYAVWEVYEAVSVPIIGMGGISNLESALEMIMAGASAVAVGMYNFVDPGFMLRLIDELDNYLLENKITNISELVGLAHKGR